MANINESKGGGDKGIEPESSKVELETKVYEKGELLTQNASLFSLRSISQLNKIKITTNLTALR